MREAYPQAVHHIGRVCINPLSPRARRPARPSTLLYQIPHYGPETPEKLSLIIGISTYWDTFRRAKNSPGHERDQIQHATCPGHHSSQPYWYIDRRSMLCINAVLGGVSSCECSPHALRLIRPISSSFSTQLRQPSSISTQHCSNASTGEWMGSSISLLPCQCPIRKVLPLAKE